MLIVSIWMLLPFWFNYHKLNQILDNATNQRAKKISTIKYNNTEERSGRKTQLRKIYFHSTWGAHQTSVFTTRSIWICATCRLYWEQFQLLRIAILLGTAHSDLHFYNHTEEVFQAVLNYERQKFFSYLIHFELLEQINSPISITQWFV